jgi:hypothetical protein
LVLKDVTPNLYKKAHFKKRRMAKELLNNSWMLAACHISSGQELLEFTEMWSLLKSVSLRNEVKDSLIWKWTPGREYTAASAYKIQFQGSHAPFQVDISGKQKLNQKFFL